MAKKEKTVTRTVNFLLDYSDPVGRALATTHIFVNRLVKEIEACLLLMRGKSYYLIDEKGEVVKRPESEVNTEALAMARAAQIANSDSFYGSDEEVLAALRKKYEMLVPSAVLGEDGKPLKGDSQTIAGRYTYLLIHSKDKWKGDTPFEDVFKKFPTEPLFWVSYDDEGKAIIDVEAAWEWARGEGRQYLNPQKGEKSSGRPSGWKMKYEEEVKLLDSDPSLLKDAKWPEKYVKDMKDKISDDNIWIRNDFFDRLHLMPLFDLKHKLYDVANGKWDRMAFRLAISHMLSWESWNHNTKKEYDNIAAKVQEKRVACEEHPDVLVRLRAYESERHTEESKHNPLYDNARPFRINARMVRNWGKVQAEWISQNAYTEDERLQILKDLQTKDRRNFGDPHFYNWIARDENNIVCKHSRIVENLAAWNGLARRLENSRPYSIYTAPDPLTHPRWTMMEAQGGTNLDRYELVQKDDQIFAKMKLIARDENGHAQLTDKALEIRLCKSGQIQNLELSVKDKKQVLNYEASQQEFTAYAGGAELLFDRKKFDKAGRSGLARQEILQRFENGDAGKVWLKMSLNIVQKPVSDRSLKEVYGSFRTLRESFGKQIDGKMFFDGFRVMSIDLGLRGFAYASVFELASEKSEQGLCYQIPECDKNIYAVHKASFPLELPGETVSQKVLEARDKATSEVYALRRAIRHLHDILRLQGLEKQEERETKLKELLDVLRGDEACVFWKDTIEELRRLNLANADARWTIKCQECFRLFETKLSDAISKWRRETRKRSRRDYFGGKSMWHVEYLTNCRELMKRWSLHSRKPQQINRANRETQGIFASNLLDHINSLKEDRIKTGADLIIQAARGYRPDDGGGWTNLDRDGNPIAPCHAVVFEDLSRYRFKTDRSRHENGQLMRWNHREIIRAAELQAELYQIVIYTAAAGYTSKFHASTGAPGVRCKRLRVRDFEGGILREYIQRRLEKLEEIHGVSAENWSAGDLIPWEGGEVFVTLLPEESLGGSHMVKLHADLNAAQNLQRRLWNRRGDAFRVYATPIEMDEGIFAYPSFLKDAFSKSAFKRQPFLLLDGLEETKGCFRLAQENDDSDQAIWKVKSFNRKNLKKLDVDTEDPEESAASDDLEDEEVYELAMLGKGKNKRAKYFFRDPSRLFVNGDWLPAHEFWKEVEGQIWKELVNEKQCSNEKHELATEYAAAH